MHVFGKGLLDTLDDVFWMLPFSGKKQSQIISRKIILEMMNGKTSEKRIDLTMAEHRLPTAKGDRVKQLKAWMAQDAFKFAGTWQPLLWPLLQSLCKMISSTHDSTAFTVYDLFLHVSHFQTQMLHALANQCNFFCLQGHRNSNHIWQEYTNNSKNSEET